LNDLGFITPLLLFSASRKGFCPNPVKVAGCQDYHLPCEDTAALILKIIDRKKLAVQDIAAFVREQLLLKSLYILKD
jgi:hypothetical protein